MGAAERLLTVAQAAERCECDAKTLRRVRRFWRCSFCAANGKTTLADRLG